MSETKSSFQFTRIKDVIYRKHLPMYSSKANTSFGMSRQPCIRSMLCSCWIWKIKRSDLRVKLIFFNPIGSTRRFFVILKSVWDKPYTEEKWQNPLIPSASFRQTETNTITNKFFNQVNSGVTFSPQFVWFRIFAKAFPSFCSLLNNN